MKVALPFGMRDGLAVNKRCNVNISCPSHQTYCHKVLKEVDLFLCICNLDNTWRLMFDRVPSRQRRDLRKN